MDEKLFRSLVLEAIKANGISVAEAARRSGVKYDVIRDLKRGQATTTGADKALSIAKGLGFDWPPTSASSSWIAVPGHVGAGDEVFLVDDYAKGEGLYHAERPPQLPEHGVVAVEVQGRSMEPAFYDGDLLFYSRDTAEGVPCEAMNRKVIAETEDGRVWVKQIKAGSEPGLFHLLSLNPTGPNMHDMRVKWAAPVRLHLPKEFVKRVG